MPEEKIYISKMTAGEKIKAFDAIYHYNTRELMDFAKWRDRVQDENDGADRVLPEGAEQRCDVHVRIARIISENEI